MKKTCTFVIFFLTEALRISYNHIAYHTLYAISVINGAENACTLRDASWLFARLTREIGVFNSDSSSRIVS